MQKSYHRHGKLLRACERPSGGGTPNKCDELPSPHRAHPRPRATIYHSVDRAAVLCAAANCRRSRLLGVKTGKARIEHMLSASHPRADICAFMNTPKRMAPTILHVGAFRDHPAAYLRRAFRSLVFPTTAP